MPSRRTLLLALCTLGMAVSAFAAAGQHTKGEKPLSISQGQKVDLADFLVTGRTTVFDFTSEYCRPCRAYADTLYALHQKRGDLAIVKVNINRPEYHEIDWDSPVAQQYALSGQVLPHFKIYGPDGKLQSEGRPARLQVNEWIAALN
jgi:thiol-disulfide isomerase/thioredoxin